MKIFFITLLISSAAFAQYDPAAVKACSWYPHGSNAKMECLAQVKDMSFAPEAIKVCNNYSGRPSTQMECLSNLGNQVFDEHAAEICTDMRVPTSMECLQGIGNMVFDAAAITVCRDFPGHYPTIRAECLNSLGNLEFDQTTVQTCRDYRPASSAKVECFEKMGRLNVDAVIQNVRTCQQYEAAVKKLREVFGPLPQNSPLRTRIRTAMGQMNMEWVPLCAPSINVPSPFPQNLGHG